MESTGRETIQLGPGEGAKTLWVLGEQVTYKVTAEQTGGAYSLFEVVSQPQGGPPPHVQHREDECLYVVEGEYELLNNDRVIRAGAGTLVFVPRGNLHAYKNVGQRPGRMMISHTPGGPHESFFEELGEEKPNTLPDTTKVVEIATRYGIEIPPPGIR